MVPLAISYEYEPCCAFKIREMTSVIKGIPYQKQPNEDFISILTGITQQKGHIHLAACNQVNEYIADVDESQNVNDKINKLASLIDRSIFNHYKLWPNNYIAHDLLNNVSAHRNKYTQTDIDDFNAYMDKELSIFKGDISLQKELLLKMYACPVINSLQSNT
jgi:hypothetical protein